MRSVCFLMRPLGVKMKDIYQTLLKRHEKLDAELIRLQLNNQNPKRRDSIMIMLEGINEQLKKWKQ